MSFSKRSSRSSQGRKSGQPIKHDSQISDYENSPQIRLLGVFAVTISLLLILVWRLFSMQYLQHEVYADKAQKQHVFEQSLQGNRGLILLDDQTERDFPVAVNRRYFVAFISVPDIPDERKGEIAELLSQEFDVPMPTIEQKISKEGDLYEVIARRIEGSRKDELVARGIPGLHFAPEKNRFYTSDKLGASVVGFVGSDGEVVRGRYGVEAYYDDKLTGEIGTVQQIRTARGGWNATADRSLRPDTDGTDLLLTIDANIQREVEKILNQDSEQYGARAGSAIVMEAKTGRILAMAQSPGFSPNNFRFEEDQSVFRNANVSQAYESGSVFKTFTLAMGLDAGVINPETTYTDTGSIKIAEYEIRNAERRVYGLQTMTQVLEFSINTGVIHVGKLLGNKKFRDYVEEFGFGDVTDIDLPAESTGTLSNLSNVNRSIEFYTASYGQGITVTPIQLTAAYGALANDGVLMRPYVLDAFRETDGTLEKTEPQVVRRVVSEKASEQMGEMLYEVVHGGHARLASVPGYKVGGKTGTAQVSSSSGGYSEDEKIATFVGYAPIEVEEGKSRYVVLVKYDNPVNVEWAATSAAPTFGRIMNYLLDYKNVQQTEEIVFSPRNLEEEEKID